ncbi:hypothetical protein [Umezawaea sp. NPDC059074]|uniref:hypothetical protein n=1 Tax=Umezawaea sp. NPDC059074 TaxID=3346716 RepID=UPI0036BBF9DE
MEFKTATADECLNTIKGLPFVRVRTYATDDHGSHKALQLVSYGDYHGTDSDAANYRELIARHGEVFYTSERGHGERSLLILNDRGVSPFAAALDNSDALDKLRVLAAELSRLEDYPLLSEAQQSKYVDELADAAWEEWLKYEVRGELQLLDSTYEDWEDATPAGGGDVETEFREAYYAYSGNEWVCETATSVVNTRHEEAVSYAARTVFGWDV